MTLRELIKLHEGIELHPYTDTAGKVTLGYGRNLTDVGITRAEAEMMLDADLERALLAARAVVPTFDTLDHVRQTVLTDMAFNMGSSRLAQFRQMLDAVGKKDWARARAEMLNSVWAEQVGARADRLAYAMEHGVFREDVARQV